MSDIEGLPDPYEGERLDRDARLCGRAWREGWAAREAADERLREALAFYADKGNYTAQNPVGSGAHVKRQTRAWLESEGLKPIPVYHPLVDGWDYFDELVDRYDRICVGNLVQASQTTRDKIIVTLHERLRRLKPARRPWVHLLGLGPYRTLAACPVNSCDTSNHVQSMRWGAIVPGAQALGAFSRLYGFLYDRERYDDPVIGYHAYGELISYLGHLDERSWRNFLSDRERILGLPPIPPLERGEPATLTPASVTP